MATDDDAHTDARQALLDAKQEPTVRCHCGEEIDVRDDHTVEEVRETLLDHDREAHDNA